jgi:1-deoxy-D-xylulose-5-phosphate reductoisomerase
MEKRIASLGSTGSVGRNVLDVIAHHADDFEVVGLSAGKNYTLLRGQCLSHPGSRFAVCNTAAHDEMAAADSTLRSRSAGHGDESLLRLIEEAKPDLVVNCLMGFAGLKPTLHALGVGIPVAMANKEAVVTGGEILKKESQRTGAEIIPIDSEIVAIGQCLKGHRPQEVKKVYLTASGGALRDRPLDEIAGVGVSDVLAHPTWSMGDKITVDSATLINKGLEVIEARWLFDLPLGKIDVVIHPQSIVHAMVEFSDNSILAQMGIPDMRLPILSALTHPERIITDIAKSNIADFPELSFTKVDESRYPCFALAFRAAEMGGNAPTVLSSANEVAVGSFLADKIPFSKIYSINEMALECLPHEEVTCFEDILESDRETREFITKKFSV